jgi:hypothetical protein
VEMEKVSVMVECDGRDLQGLCLFKSGCDERIAYIENQIHKLEVGKDKK